MIRRVCLILAGILTACTDFSFQNSPISKENPAYGDDLVIGIFHQPSLLNPLVTDSTISANLLDLVFDTLVQVNSKQEIVPHLAERWDIKDDGRTWIFHLKRGVLFHDGIELTAEDVKFTFETVSKLKHQGYRFFFNFLKSVEVQDQYTLRIHLSHYDRALWGGLLGVNIVPKRLFGGLDIEKAPFNDKPIGTGPYRFVSQNREEIILDGNPRYFLGMPFLHRIKIKVFPSQRSNLTHLVSGEVDLLFMVGSEDYDIIAQIPEVKIFQNWNRILHLLFINSKKEIFKSSKIRRAMSLGIDRKKIISASPHEKWEEATGPLYKTEKFLEGSSESSYNPSRALKLFEEEGWKYFSDENLLKKGGRPFSFSVISVQGEELYEKILSKIQTQFLSLGIKAKAELLPATDFFDTLFKRRDFDMALYRYTDHPFYFVYYNFWHSSQINEGLNFSYSNSEVDSALEIIRLDLDENNRSKAYQKLQKTFQDDPPAIFLFWRKLPIAVHKRFRGIPEDHMDSFKEFRKVWVPKEEQKYLK